MTNQSSSSRRSIVIAGFGFALLAAIVALAGLFARAEQTSRVAHQARVLERSQDLTVATVAVRFASGDVLLLAEAGGVGVEVDDALQSARTDLERSVRRLAELADVPVGLTDEFGDRLAPLIARIETEAVGLLSAVASGDLTQAEAASEAELLTDTNDLLDELRSIRESAVERVAMEEGSAGAVSRAASFGVAILLPALALWIFGQMAKRRQEQAKTESDLRLERELNREKDVMIGNLSHELRTPLTTVYGFALAMEEQGFTDPAFQAEMTGLIISEAAELNRMVDDLLTAAKANEDALRFQIEDVAVRREIDEVLMAVNRGETQIEVECESALVRADRLRLRQVLRNLVANAKAHGGPRISVKGEVAEDGYRLAVVDNGLGVPAGVEERLFERFVHRGEAPLTTGSVGLGLSIAHLLVTGMGGRLSYHRGDDETVFLVQIPLAAEQPSEAWDGEVDAATIP